MNEPKVIFLQIRRDMGDEEDSFLDCEDITWCIDSQFETDIEYCKITAAELAALRARVGELERERDAVKETLAVALVALWKSHDSNDDDRDTVSDELASKHFATWEEIFALETAALAKGAK